MGRVQDKVALIVGAASGMGLASAELFAKEGAIVILADLNDTAGEAAAQRIRDAGGRAIFKRMDVHDEASVRAAMEEMAFDNGGRIDILVNCSPSPRSLTAKTIGEN
jgi:NAD(P)-dependent dehydrogenase (short-subunit alcohol dehydrogenase family)